MQEKEEKEIKSANYKFLLEKSISETFEFTLFQTRMRNKSALFRAFISDFITNPDFYKTRLNIKYQKEINQDKRRTENNA